MSSLIDAPSLAGRLPDDESTERIVHFDATQPRKERMRKAAAGEKIPDVSGMASALPPKVESLAPPIPPATKVVAPRATESGPANPPAAIASPPPTAETGLSRADLERFLIDFVVEQTGYPAEMVELDVDLEADLGIDSIKKAQLFGELAEQFGIQPPADANELSLDDFPTLRHVVNFLEQAPGGNSAQTVNRNGATASPPAGSASPPAGSSTVPGTVASTPASSAGNGSASAPSQSQPAMSATELETFLVNFVVEQTGYPAEMVELDADLEADLGIDSIKKAQLFGELAEQFGIQPPADASELSLDDFPTLRHVVGFLQSATAEGTCGKSAETTAPGMPFAPTTSTVPSAVAPSAAVAGPMDENGSDVAEPADSESERENDLETFLINFVVEQTGYPVEMVELEADLEADLGIDSIKKAQLFGELAEYFEIQVTEDLSLDDFPTLGHVREFLRDVPRKVTV